MKGAGGGGSVIRFFLPLGWYAAIGFEESVDACSL